MQELEKIYNDVVTEYERIERFNRLTSLTYELALASVEQGADSKAVLKLPDRVQQDKMSYSAADRKVESIELIRGWITLEEYSKKVGLSVEEVQKNSDKGEYGEVKEKNGKSVIFWPPEEQGGDDLPAVESKNSYSITVSVRGSVSIDMESSLDEMISYLGPIDLLKKKTSEAMLLLNRETFLLYWSAFEQYVKNMTFALFELYPEQVFKNKKYGKNQMTYSEIFVSSTKFTSIQNLKDFIINCILGDPSTEREAISKQIVFIQDCFLGNSKSPYDTWYVLNGERKGINYQVLDQVRIIRNALVHKNGEMTEGWENIDLISRPENDRIVVNDDLLLKIELILKSISHNIYILISKSLKQAQ